jgi:ribosomal protein S7
MRRRRADKRDAITDPKYNSPLVAKFINVLMTEGKKTVAESIVYEALEISKKKTSEDSALKVFNKALENVRPRLELKPRRVGGATYQIPVEVNALRGNSLPCDGFAISPEEKRESQWLSNWPTKLRVLTRVKDQPSRSAMKLIKWLNPTRPLLI